MPSVPSSFFALCYLGIKMRLNKGILFAHLIFSSMVYAQKAPISLDRLPGSITSGVLSTNQVAVVRYRVTNNSTQTLTFTMESQSGVEEIFDDSFACLASQSLGPNQSCILTVLLNGGAIPASGTNGGPVLDASPFLLSQPLQDQQLHYTSTSTETEDALSSNVSGIALSVNNTSLNANLTGNPRVLTITNNGATTAKGLGYAVVPSLPEGTSIDFPCTNLQPEDSCTITITPGAAAITVPTSIVVYSVNTNALYIPLNILTYGSVYQSGYVFSIDDSYSDYPETQSVGGKVAALTNQATFWPFGIIWSSNGVYGCKQTNPPTENAYAPCTSYVKIDGINELSTTPCDGKSDGACNTEVIVNYYNNTAVNKPIDLTAYAAGLCKAPIAGYSDWYLPAICEMGYHVPSSPNVESYCGSVSDPLMQNMQSNLKDLGLGGLLLGVFWSSTEYSNTDKTQGNSWSQYFFNNVSSYQTHDGKENPSGVRCVRALTQPT